MAAPIKPSEVWEATWGTNAGSVETDVVLSAETEESMTQEPPSGASLAEWRGYFQSRFDHGKDDVMTYDVFPEPAGTTTFSEVWGPEDDAALAVKLEEIYGGPQRAHIPAADYAAYDRIMARRQAAIPDHAEAAADALQRIVDKLRGGTSPEDLGRDVELLGRVMARRT